MRVLTVQHLRKTFNGKATVGDLSFAAYSGSVFGLLGPNGAGKTTTVRMIMRILLPDGGRIAYDGQSVADIDPGVFGYMPEERGIYPRMRLGAQLRYFLRLHGLNECDAEERSHYISDRYRLKQFLGRRPMEVSKGTLQRFQFALTIAHDPDVLILDEPFSGLDPLTIEQLTQDILDYAARGKIVVLSSHRLDQVEAMCSNICILRIDQPAIVGATAKLKKSWADRVLKIAPFTPIIIERHLPMARLVSQDKFGAELVIPRGLDFSDILSTLVRSQIITAFEFREPTLREMYLSTVQSIS